MTESTSATGDEEQPGDRDPVDFDSATPAAEWAVAIVGAVLAIVIVGLLIVQAVRTPPEPPMLSTHLTEVTGVQVAGHLASVEIRNIGGRAATDVQITGDLMVDGQPVESASATVDYIPAGTTRTVLLQFTRDPEDGRVAISSLGFTDD